MLEIRQILNSQSEAALASILGENISITFPNAWIDINREGVSTSSISLFKYDSQSYVIVDTDLAETNSGWLEYAIVNVFLADLPHHIEDPEKASNDKPYNVCTLLTWKPTIIQSVSIYQQSRLTETEIVKYDSGILLEFDSGRVLFSSTDSFPDRLEINHKETIIEELLRSMTIRKTLNQLVN